MRGPYVTLTPISKSHPFEDRKAKVGLEEDPLKIGRAVARLKPSADNAIFDCKVLSRNHAVLWFKDGDFFLKDTKSSNGTFVNNERLAVTGEESRPKQVYTGDIIQLGVEIVENANKASVAHGCIYAMVQLYDVEGNAITTVREVTSTTNNDKVNANFSPSQINNHQLFQLQQFISEANFREEQRQKKLKELEEMVEVTEGALAATRKAVIDEDRLLSRIESLEAQLLAAAKGISGDKVKEDMQTFMEDKYKFEQSTKEAIKRAQEERAEAEMRLTDVDRSLVATEEECNRFRQKLIDTEARLTELVEQYDVKQAEIASLSAGLTEMERRVNVAEEHATAAEKRADDAVVDRDCDRSMQMLIRHLSEAIRVEDYTAHEQQLAGLADMLRERGVGAPESVPEPPQHVEKSEGSPSSLSCSSCDLLTAKHVITATELEQSLKENLDLKARIKELEGEIESKEIDQMVVHYGMQDDFDDHLIAAEKKRKARKAKEREQRALEGEELKKELEQRKKALERREKELELVSAQSVSSEPVKVAVKPRVDPFLASVALFSVVPWLAVILAVLWPLNQRYALKKAE